ncbi:hypothetical protein GCM10010977_33050 [Citricoccus zhacaiensis]|uniref:DUF3054 domain-containing protein n=1 Tax=Citricoccus zhacaiensis TaxID=489142 RepID=A0ABQ2MDV9_9MICC|nr:DUF3054 domain-containing protein [Citricoccus zhacaiensis]GGO49961.1 hypothetical protein GCM10010977_33050 [Citricoccus zhacaiensis]
MPASFETPSPAGARTMPHTRTQASRWVWMSLILDAVLIVLFAAQGRKTHESGMDLGGILLTALPFLLAWAISTAVTRPHRTWAQIWPAGVVVWLVTVVGGLALRVAFGGTAALAFQWVTAGALAVLLLGRRAVTALILRSRRRSRS